METLIILLIALTLINAIMIYVLRAKPNQDANELIEKVKFLDLSLQKIEGNLKEDFKINREENANLAKDNRTELNNTLKDLKKELTDTLREINEKTQKDNTLMRGIREIALAISRLFAHATHNLAQPCTAWLPLAMKKVSRK